MAHDIFTEPEDIDLDTLRNLGPLAPLAGVWEGEVLDTHPMSWSRPPQGQAKTSTAKTFLRRSAHGTR